MLLEAISYKQIRIDLPVALQHITKLHIKQGLNQHAIACITGVLEEHENIMPLYKLSIDTPITIKTEAEQSEIIFRGVPTKLNIRHQQGLYEVDLEISSYSILLDFKKHARSFQDKNKSYELIFKEIIEGYKGDILDKASNGKIQNRVNIQYQETDWEFLIRLAAQLETIVYPEVLGEKPQIYIGIAKKNNDEIYTGTYEIEKDLKTYLEFTENAKPTVEANFLTYTLESIQNFSIGNQINYQNTAFIIIEKISQLENGILNNHYKIKKKEGIKVNKCYNSNLKGTAIEGKVIDRKKDQLKLHLAIDSTQNLQTANWYSMETIYEGSGSTGWYCMPEIGDSVKLYLPTKDENDGYIKANERKNSEENPKLEDPSIKSYETIFNKEMKLTPNAVSFIAQEKKVHIKLMDDNGIAVESSEPIKISGGKNIDMTCQSIRMNSNDKIILSTRIANIIVDQIVHLKG
ncbi:MAG: hypothetical protein AB9856_06950 [Cellulosilyticaceae bacterium]